MSIISPGFVEDGTLTLISRLFFPNADTVKGIGATSFTVVSRMLENVTPVICTGFELPELSTKNETIVLFPGRRSTVTGLILREPP